MMSKTFNTLSFLVVTLLLLTTGVHSATTQTGVRGAGAAAPSMPAIDDTKNTATSSSSSLPYECPVNAPSSGAQCEVPNEPHVCEYLHIHVPSDFDADTGVCSGELICKPTAICGCGANGRWECFDMDYVSRCNTENHFIPGAFSWCNV